MKFEEIERLTEAFVKKETKNRDATHGFQHMRQVANVAMSLINGVELQKNQRLFIMIVALLHDVPEDGQLKTKVLNFLTSLYFKQETRDNIFKCIQAISYSREKKQGWKYYEDELDPYWVTVRDYVSDADKSLALGVSGFQRLYDYCGLLIPPDAPMRETQIMTQMAKHAQDKLLTLPAFFRTDQGQELAGTEYMALIGEFNKTAIWQHMLPCSS